MNFSKAAVLLNLTQSAISKQIAQLEELMGCSLFERNGGKVELTDAGRRYLPSVVEALENLQHATSSVMQSSETKSRVELSVPPSMASMWLIPRLSDFRSKHPKIDLVVRASVTADGKTDIKAISQSIVCHYRPMMRMLSSSFASVYCWWVRQN
nr:LysR family transcriptional regulator [Enterovibrio nigricans]